MRQQLIGITRVEDAKGPILMSLVDIDGEDIGLVESRPQGAFHALLKTGEEPNEYVDGGSAWITVLLRTYRTLTQAVEAIVSAHEARLAGATCESCLVSADDEFWSHEDSCPRWKERWDPSDGRWIERRRCEICGSNVDLEDPCCSPKARTPKELETLKAQWLADPCWDLESTTGFEAHVQELFDFRSSKQDEWARERLLHLETRAKELACSTELVAHIEKLEDLVEAQACILNDTRDLVFALDRHVR